MNLYPNPVNHILHISVDNYELYHIKIYNVIGELIFEKEMKDQNSKLDLSHFTKGVYFIEMQTNGGRVTKKLIKH